MSDEITDWLEQQLRGARIADGKELDPHTMGERFLQFKNFDRATILNTLDTKLSVADLTIERATKIHRYRRALINADRAAKRVHR